MSTFSGRCQLTQEIVNFFSTNPPKTVNLNQDKTECTGDETDKCLTCHRHNIEVFAIRGL